MSLSIYIYIYTHIYIYIYIYMRSSTNNHNHENNAAVGLGRRPAAEARHATAACRVALAHSCCYLFGLFLCWLFFIVVFFVRCLLVGA